MRTGPKNEPVATAAQEDEHAPQPDRHPGHRLRRGILRRGRAVLERGPAALGRERVGKNERFESLRGRVGGEGGMFVGLQRGMDDPQKFHVDIETDDVEAEVARLVGLGAQVKRRIRNHVILRAPGGHTFCVIPATRSDFEGHATRWD